ncbi:MAG TPA: hypothetical protein DCL95_13555 [Rhodospirillaceae bacterium]|nr:hypothetical protein [Rhodospirillaceae bacterium]MAX62426.1 hypothetical protein [Rhodospirillaceae bacterium]MBB56824.1 hypothetical protein [Rhodospirillaceae bacterium]HAJ21061.1 hypothetical protein [Rhodospirillaceae bacterium]
MPIYDDPMRHLVRSDVLVTLAKHLVFGSFFLPPRRSRFPGGYAVPARVSVTETAGLSGCKNVQVAQDITSPSSQQPPQSALVKLHPRE